LPVVYPVLRALYAPYGGRVPDLRGMFLRGIGGNSAGLGQTQGDAIRNITARWETRAGDMPGMADGAAFTSYIGNWASAVTSRTSWEMNFDASRVVPTASENRPVNMAVRYLIRAAL